MSESVPICQAVDASVSDTELQNYMSELRDPGGAHRVWVERQNGKRVVCRTYWIEEAPLTAASPALTPPGTPSVTPRAPSAAPVAPVATPPPAGGTSRDLDKLVEEFRSKVTVLIECCAARGIVMRPFCTERSPFEQARLWRQSRSKEEINAKIAELNNKSAPFLADCIERIGTQLGEQVTNAIPGLSWHQWGEALDCFWLVQGEANWSTRKKINGLNGYHVYAEEAKAVGLTAGGNWQSFKDWPHIQLRSAGSPLRLMSMREIDELMRARFDT